MILVLELQLSKIQITFRKQNHIRDKVHVNLEHTLQMLRAESEVVHVKNSGILTGDLKTTIRTQYSSSRSALD